LPPRCPDEHDDCGALDRHRAQASGGCLSPASSSPERRCCSSRWSQPPAPTDWGTGFGQRTFQPRTRCGQGTHRWPTRRARSSTMGRRTSTHVARGPSRPLHRGRGGLRGLPGVPSVVCGPRRHAACPWRPRSAGATRRCCSGRPPSTPSRWRTSRPGWLCSRLSRGATGSRSGHAPGRSRSRRAASSPRSRPSTTLPRTPSPGPSPARRSPC